MLLKTSPDQNTNNASEIRNGKYRYLHKSQQEKCLFAIPINVWQKANSHPWCGQLSISHTRTVPPDGPVLVQSRIGTGDQNRASHAEPCQRRVTCCCLCPFPPDYKHSSGRQQQTGRRPYAILVRHNPLLGGSWTKSTSKGSESNQECKFRQIHENTNKRTSTVFISGHLPLFSCILVPKRRTTTKSRTAPIVAANQTAARLLTSPCAEEDGRW